MEYASTNVCVYIYIMNVIEALVHSHCACRRKHIRMCLCVCVYIYIYIYIRIHYLYIMHSSWPSRLLGKSHFPGQEHDGTDVCKCTKDSSGNVALESDCPVRLHLSNFWVDVHGVKAQEGQDRTEALYNAFLDAVKLGCTCHVSVVRN
jgi:hypothetical protein